ncbi:hypothetical protein, partial [Nocardia farcinica]|uniref:hypothetical protein n=1 Tax=Nocardia farcinica TaxID=37329 RepID=UPI00245443F5
HRRTRFGDRSLGVVEDAQAALDPEGQHRVAEAFEIGAAAGGRGSSGAAPRPRTSSLPMPAVAASPRCCADSIPLSLLV